MIQVRITAEERDLLLEVLESYISDARMEIADTDSAEFKVQLKTRNEMLSRIAEALRKGGETA